jgi:gas vesicle protein
MSTSKFFAGALVGIVAGLLLAPAKGEDLRSDLADTAEKWKRKFYRLAGKTGAELQDLRDLLEDEIEGLDDDVRERLLIILDETANTARNIKRNFTSELG